MNWSVLKEPGNIVVIIAIVIFYARIMWLRQDMKRKAEMVVIKQKKTGKGSKLAESGKPKPAVSEQFLNPKYQITNWALGGPGIVLMLLGLVSRTSNWLPEIVNPYWYIAAGVGALMLTFSINTK